MSARRILIVFGTTYGQTAKVARFIADQLTAAGETVTLANADELRRNVQLPRGASPRDFDGAIVGASVIYGHHRRSVQRFVSAHRDALNAMPSAFFSVSGSAANSDEEKLADARKVVDEFLRRTGWRPGLTETVAGTIAYTKYSPLLRWTMKRLAARQNSPTDTSRDHEFTDWAQVRRFAESFAGTLPPAQAELPLVHV